MPLYTGSIEFLLSDEPKQHRITKQNMAILHTLYLDPQRKITHVSAYGAILSHSTGISAMKCDRITLV